MAFRSRGDSAGFEIMELAGTRNIGKQKKGLTPQGRGMIRALNAVAPVQGGLGRFVIPQAKDEAGAVMSIARRTLLRSMWRLSTGGFRERFNQYPGGV